MRQNQLRVGTVWALAVFAVIGSAQAGLTVTSLGRLAAGMPRDIETGQRPGKWQEVKRQIHFDHDRVVIKQVTCAMGGNTSVRNASPLKWKTKGYFQRNRDLGQVFTAEEGFRLDAIVLRTGPDDMAFLAGSDGAPVFIQFFEVSGAPVIDDNNTPPGTDATHGFSTNHRCDDFVRGVKYQPLHVVTGGILPDIAADGDGRLTYLKWDLTGEDELSLEAGKRYAFMVGITQPGPGRGFTLANFSNAASPAPPGMNDGLDRYGGGWGLRREGNGRTPPMMLPSDKPPSEPSTLKELQNESYFPDFEARLAIPPTCDGYPDVDTYRDLEFYLLAAE
jgi:hypothetical protein